MKDQLPLVSVVTPVLNGLPFVAETIESVFAQTYPEIEYIVIDGGSTDGTLEILKAYEQRSPGRIQFRYITGPDGGTADAINRGFRLSRGSIFAFLNADDLYTPGAIETAVRCLEDNPSTAVIYGEADWVGADGSVIARYPTCSFDAKLLRRQCFICQPASFIRREAFERVGMLDTGLHYAFDYELWLRIAEMGDLVRIDHLLAKSRMHRASKTLRCREQAFAETVQMLKGHFGYVPYSWVYSYVCYLMDKRDQFFEPLRPNLGKYISSLPMGWYLNWRNPLRYSMEWLLGFAVPGRRGSLR